MSARQTVEIVFGAGKKTVPAVRVSRGLAVTLYQGYDGRPPRRGEYVVTHVPTGYTISYWRGPKRDALRLLHELTRVKAARWDLVTHPIQPELRALYAKRRDLALKRAGLAE